MTPSEQIIASAAFKKGTLHCIANNIKKNSTHTYLTQNNDMFRRSMSDGDITPPVFTNRNELINYPYFVGRVSQSPSPISRSFTPFSQLSPRRGSLPSAFRTPSYSQSMSAPSAWVRVNPVPRFQVNRFLQPPRYPQSLPFQYHQQPYLPLLKPRQYYSQPL